MNAGVEFDRHIRRQHVVGSDSSSDITDKKSAAAAASDGSGGRDSGLQNQSPRVTSAGSRSGQSTPRVRFDDFVFEYALNEDDYDADTT